MAQSQTRGSPFTIHNLPYGVISSKENPKRRCAVAFGDHAVDLSTLHQNGLFSGIAGLEKDLFDKEYLNSFAALDGPSRQAFRQKLREYLETLPNNSSNPALIPLSEVQNHFPMDTRNFSDFYCSLEHTKNCSDIFSLKINPNWFAAPSVYNGRTSSLLISGTPITRPCGMFPDPSNGNKPAFQPEGHLDFELEMGVWLCKPVPRGQRLDITEAKSHIFGMTLLNDWSSRDIQFFEMQPLGPFHSKGSGTSVSPWIIPIEALEEVAACARATNQEPPPPPHLTWPGGDLERATYDVEVSVKVLRNGETFTIGESNLRELHWTPMQQITHLASAGEGLSTGDVFGTGTISSSRTNDKGEKNGLGCLWERKLPSARLSSIPQDLMDTLLRDGDEVIMEGWCIDRKTGEVLLGFGESRGKVMPAQL